VPLVARTTKQDKVRDLQRTLYRAAKADPGRRFHALYDKVHRRDVLERAWELVRANRGAAGIDRQTIADVEEYGIAKLLDELAADLRNGRWRPLPARRVFISKPGREELRPLSIPSVRDRVVQAAAKIVIEPIFEADFMPCSFGFRHVLKLLRAMLRAGVLQDGSVRRSDAGTPQGGVISPVLCNVYLNRLDRQWAKRGRGVLVRYADDLLAMCKTRGEAEDAREALTVILAEMGLEPKQAKTRIVRLTEGGEGLDFLGFHHRWVRSRDARFKHVEFLARWPSRQAMQHARDRVRELTGRDRLRWPIEQVVGDLNRFLRGWAGYFRYGNSTVQFDQIIRHADRRLALLIANRYQQPWRYGRQVLNSRPDRYGLITLNGTIAAPRPNRPWRQGAECRR
jgi:RNA-directed DNA polymerase